MPKKNLILFTIPLFFISVDSQNNDDVGRHDSKVEKLSTPDHEAYFRLRYLILSLCILCCTIIRHILKVKDRGFPFGIFCVLLGFLFGLAALHSPWVLLGGRSTATHSMLMFYEDIVVPIIIYSTAFVTDYYTFMKSLVQIIIIGIPVALICTVLTGEFMKIVTDVGSTIWTHHEAAYLGSFFIAIYPVEVLHWLKQASVLTKYVKVLLHGEAIVSTCVCAFVNFIIKSYGQGWVVFWYQFVISVLKAILLGIPCGYIFGCIGCSLMKVVFNDLCLLILLSVCMCFTSYFTVAWICQAGTVASAITGIMMGVQRNSLSKDLDAHLLDFWKMISTAIVFVLLFVVGMKLVLVMHAIVKIQEVIFVCITYLTLNIARFLSFFLFSPILSRTGYGLTFQQMILCVGSGIKSPISLSLILSLVSKESATTSLKDEKIFYTHVVGVYVLTLLINGACLKYLLRALGLWGISSNKQATMNNCMKLIYEARAKTIAILKMDRFVSDANWPLVTTSTALKHPHHKKTIQEDDEDEIDDEDFDFMRYKFTYCPDCEKNIPNEPTPKELKEMTKEAKIRILKLKKTAYFRLYENGMITNRGVKILHQAVEIAMESKNLTIELDGLFKLFNKENKMYKYLRNGVQHFFQTKGDVIKPPRKKWMLWCYYMIKQNYFLLCAEIIVALNIIIICVYLADEFSDEVFFILILLFFFFYFLECLLKMFAFTWHKFCKHGVVNYFRQIWCRLEFLILCVTFVQVIVTLQPLPYILIVLLIIRAFNILLYLKYLSFLKPLPDKFLRYLEVRVHHHKLLAFEIAKSYIATEEEILTNLHTFIDNHQIRKNLKEQIETDCLAVCRRLGIAQKETPWIASTAKTKISIRAVLQSMKDDIEKLRYTGWVDDIEYSKLLSALGERYRYISTISLIQPSPPKLIFRDVPYMGTDHLLLEYLYGNIATKKFDPGDVIFKNGEPCDGIYVLITGLFVAHYTPSADTIRQLKDFGALPAIDVVSYSYEEDSTEYILPGYSMGELSTLTGRPYNGMVIAETYSEVYFIRVDIIKNAIKMDADIVNGIESRIWKSVLIGRALHVLTKVPAYRSLTQEQIRGFLERSFVPNLSNYKIFIVTSMMQDILLMQGLIIDFNTREIFTAPCYIPRAVQKLVLPQSDIFNINTIVETKLLIIPAQDYDEYEVMVSGEEECELVDQDSSKCLQHFIQEKLANQKIQRSLKKQKGIKSGNIRRIKSASVGSASANRSKITFTDVESTESIQKSGRDGSSLYSYSRNYSKLS